jgi:hypothetical protein
MSPDGQYLLRLVENVHRLIPYYVVKQTLRVGNAATMINGMVRLVLAKLSVTAVTNWMGFTNNTNDGMNLMQQIISQVMSWDTAEFQKRTQKLESSRDAPPKAVFKAIKSYVYASRDVHDAARSISIAESKSIICVILETADSPIDTDTLKEHQHEVAMEYFSNLLSMRDREELTKVLCKSNPDLLTPAIRDVVSAFDPVIRGVHNAVDLSGTVTDAENFIGDLIKISKPKKSSGSSRGNSRASSPTPSAPASVTDDPKLVVGVPTVEDYVNLLRKHIPSAHKFLHQVAKNAPELTNQYREYAKNVLLEFKGDANPISDPSKSKEKKEEGENGAGTMTAPLQSLFATLPEKKQEELKPLLDHHENHLKQLKSTSQGRLQAIMHSASPSRPTSTHKDSKEKPPPHANGTTHGPGMYLSRWHSLLDSTLITPCTLHGPVRHGYEVKGELDGKGLKTTEGLRSRVGNRMSSRDRSLGLAQGIADGTGDSIERKERKRDAKEENKTIKVWEGLAKEWKGVTSGLEVMGP